MTATHTTGDEQVLVNADSGVSYRPLDELTDSDEAEMDMSGDENDEPSTKRARLPGSQADGDSEPKFAPRWSNPDPYTVLPPVDNTTTGKKKDVVQLIRKARIQTGEARPSLPTAAEEFISFDADSDEGEGDEPSGCGPSGSGAASIAAASKSAATPALRAPSPATVETPRAQVGSTPVGQDISLAQDSDSALGSRKRTHDDHIKQQYTRPIFPMPPTPLCPEWEHKGFHNSAPWYRHHDDVNTTAEL